VRGGEPSSGAGVWWEAARPRTLGVSLIPVLVGGALAHHQRGFRPGALLAAGVGALAIQVATNFANDAEDAARGADADRVGPRRLVAAGLVSRATMIKAALIAFGVAALAGVVLVAMAGRVVVAIGLASIVAALGYVGGPLPYGYRGWGELFAFLFFGPVATVGSRFVHDRTAPAEAWWLAVPIGMLAAAILLANNLRDLETDAAAGKLTLAVRLGAGPSRAVYLGLMMGAFAVLAGTAAFSWVPGWSALGLLALAFSPPLVSGVGASGAQLGPLLWGTARLQMVGGLLIAIGLFAS